MGLEFPGAPKSGAAGVAIKIQVGTAPRAQPFLFEKSVAAREAANSDAGVGGEGGNFHGQVLGEDRQLVEPGDDTGVGWVEGPEIGGRGGVRRLHPVALDEGGVHEVDSKAVILELCLHPKGKF